MNGNGRSFRTSMTSALFSALIVAFVAAPALAQKAAPPTRERVLWWNDQAVVMRLKLTAETRTKMDQVYGWHQPAIEELKVGRLRQAFTDSLKKGDWKASTAALQTWADGEQKAAKLAGDLKIGVLSLLSSEQLAELVESAGNQILRAPWKPKASWGLRHKQVSP